ncbi:MAG: hypothetical protein KIH10_16430 [Candidatus Freyarchaeota archaeon]|nr:hypothetical protein [Candidatus Jordarchaeia archaeon]MBS7280561.1 hypothetical protein [Candidatus Jordarchaeia archaeon]
MSNDEMSDKLGKLLKGSRKIYIDKNGRITTKDAPGPKTTFKHQVWY